MRLDEVNNEPFVGIFIRRFECPFCNIDKGNSIQIFIPIVFPETNDLMKTPFIV